MHAQRPRRARRRHRLRLPLAALGATALVAAPTLAAATPLLQQLVLKPSQVGSRYRVRTIPGGNRVAGQVTLDLCGFNFPSERYRVARLQVAYVRAGGPGLSNEVVRYARSTIAAAAIGELRYAERHCPSRPVRSRVQGVPLMAYRLAELHDQRLSSPSLALLMHLTATVSGKRQSRNVVAVYQVRGAVLSAIYTDGSGSAALQERLALHAAEQSARNLRNAR